MEIVLVVVGFSIGFALAWFLGRQKILAEKLVLQPIHEQQRITLESLAQEKQVLLSDLQSFREKSVRLEVEKESSVREIEKAKEDLKKMEEMLIGKFENLSNRIFEEKSEKFKTQSQESLGVLLTPLREKIAEFQKKVDDSFGQQAKEQFSLKEQIKNIVEASSKMSVQTENLTKALKSDSKMQGNWGEVVLEKILEESGLRKGIDYTVQGEKLGLRDVETDRLQKPDVIVNLPDGKHIIIDSKVSLTHYERFFSEIEESARAVHLKQFLSAVKDRIKELEERRYQDTEKLGTPNFVLMFMPIEASYFLAMQEDPELHSYAWNKNVAIVCPTTLFAMLRTVASQWRLELQNRNAQEIAQQGGSLYNAIADFAKDMEILGKQIGTVGKTHEAAMKKLSRQRGNILGRTEKLRELGAKTSKSMPIGLLDFNETGDDVIEEIEQNQAA